MDATNAGGSSPTGRAAKGATKLRRRASVSDGPAPYGALDLGTNNCRLLIARPSNSSLAVVDAFSRIVRLGEGLGRTGELSEDAMRRTIEALRVCSNKLKWHDVGERRLIATEACRLAGNGMARSDLFNGLASPYRYV